MNSFQKFTLVVVFAFVAPQSFANPTAGQVIWEYCSTKDGKIGGAFCLGFATGLIDGATGGALKMTHHLEGDLSEAEFANNLESGLNFCVPSTVTKGEMVKTFIDYLERSPDELQRPAVQLYLEAMSEKYPCT
ncbi:Rap1a/Tai family immunity protein [Cognatishimia sp. D5M38]|uniref:Rap1a/Tai family immunity protein n=1 Tax=Cognatishimia coralii TaxID=3083254 RepID=A0ABU8QG92_9RHOB